MIRLMVKSRCRFPEHHTVIGRWTQDKKNIPVSETSRLESGFTLIELMVVLLIMGILMAIVPGLLSIPKENLPYPERRILPPLQHPWHHIPVSD